MAITKAHVLWYTCMLASVSWVEANVLGDIGEQVNTGVLGDINTVAHPIDSVVLTTATSHCEVVKSFLGVTYNQLDDKNEPDLNKLKVYFKTKEGQQIYNINEAAEEIPKNPNFNRSQNVAVYLHGFLVNPNTSSFAVLTDALVAKGGYNVLALDASSLIAWYYLRASTYVRFIGNKIGEVIVAMTNEGIGANSISVVGHSLGAHIGSFACKTYSDRTNNLIARLTGLDPAGPCFAELKDDLKLKKTDAKFVDVIHTDAGVYGTAESLGQVDYYPNGGFNQPNCLLQTCSHSRSSELYTSSVQHPDSFVAKKCNSWDDFKRNKCDDSDVSSMGYASAPDSFGHYYLVTDGVAPYGLGKEGLKYTGGAGVLSNAEHALTG